MVRTRNNRSGSGGGGGSGGAGSHKDNAATLRPAAKKGRKRQLTESSSASQASMLTASSALSPLPGPSSALVALVAPQESDWHLAGPGQANNNNLEELEEQTDHDIVPVAGGAGGDLVIFSHRDTAAPVSLNPSVSSGDETSQVKEDASCSLMLPEDLKANLECPVCARISLPPIMQCRNGHVTCNPCRLKVQSCPMCREVDIDIR